MSQAKTILEKINKKGGWNDKDKLLLCLMFITDHTDMDAFEEFLTEAMDSELLKEAAKDDDDEEDDDDIDDDEDEI